jgi:hypothetical protein
MSLQLQLPEMIDVALEYAHSGWTRVALFVQREKHRLPAKHHEFVDDMAARAAHPGELTSKQHQYLCCLFFKLGGKIT